MDRKLCATAITTLMLILCFTTPTALAQANIDLVQSSVTISGTPAAGTTLQVTDTLTNQGSASAPNSYTNMFLSTNGTTKNAFVGYRYVASIAAGASSTATTNVTLPSGIAGKYYLLVCTNANSAVTETVYTNNCLASSSFTVAGADLVESSVTVAGTPASGSAMQVLDTVTNQGAAAAGASHTNMFLSKDGKTKSSYLGAHTVAALAVGASAGPTTTNVTLPTNLSGNYFVIVCTNANNAVLESDTTNDCTASAPFAVAGPNLTETVTVAQSGVLTSGTMQVTDMVTNVGAGSADASYTNYWLSVDGVAKNVFLGNRSVVALAAGAKSGPITTNFTVPGVVGGTYFVMACANANNAVSETNYADNCGASSPVSILSAAATVIVDPAGLDAVACGTSAAPCKTINGALAAATGKTNILLNPGVYTEQITINQTLTVTPSTKYSAVIQAPTTPLVPNADGTTSIVRIGNNANVTLRGLTIQGPGPSGCGSISYGIFVANGRATITDNKVLSVRDSAYSGCQNGAAIRFGNQALGYTGFTGTITNNIVLDFQKGGIVVDGKNTSVTVTGNTVTGQNTPGVNGQNGIQVSRNAKATVSNNIVSNAAYFRTCPTDTTDPNFGQCNLPGTNFGPKNPSAAGILLYDVNGGVTVSNNTVTNSDIGIWIAGDGPGTTNGSTNVLVKGNTVSNNRAAGIFIDTSSTSIQVYGNNTHLNGKDALGNIVGFVDSNFAQGFGYDLVDENTNEFLNDWGYSGLPGAAPNSFDTNWGNGKGLLLNY